MNKILLTIIFFLFASGFVLRAQQSVNWNIISVSSGAYSLTELTEGVYGGEYGYNSRQINKYSGTFSVTYRRYLSPRVSLGLCVAFENESGDMQEEQQPYNSSNTTKTGTFKRNVWSFAPELLINYPKETNRNIRPYGYIGIGYTFMNELDGYLLDYYEQHYYNGVNSLGNSPQVAYNRNYLNFQICPIGISFGHRLRGFFELGFGYKGILNMGALMSF